MLPKGPQAQNRRLVNTVGLHFNGLAHKAESNPPGALSTMMPKGVDFGIMEFSQANHQAIRGCLIVLNAFRHHRNSHHT